MRRLFPRPAMTLILVAFWMILNSSSKPGTLVLGFAFGWLIPFIFDDMLLEKSPGWKPFKLAKLFAIVIKDIILHNFHVAKLNLGPVKKLRPAFLEIPIELQNDTAISILVGIISMTPGTIAADLSANKRSLLVHGLDVEDADALIQEIKTRYEAPLKEIYPC